MLIARQLIILNGRTARNPLECPPPPHLSPLHAPTPRNAQVDLVNRRLPMSHSETMSSPTLHNHLLRDAMLLVTVIELSTRFGLIQ